MKLDVNLKSPHAAFSEELLVPRANNTDPQRLNMQSSQIKQAVVLKNGEYPRVFTNFENQVGEYSVAYKNAKKNFTVIKKIEKNKYNYDLIVQYDDGVYDIIHMRKAVNITENYGYEIIDRLPEDLEEGDFIEEGTPLYSSTSYDEYGNFAYGVNLKSIFLPYKGLTYEDGIVISETAAKKLEAYNVEETVFTINNNDIMLNLYGTDENYKSIPEVGEETKGSVLAALRRVDNRSVMYSFQNANIKEIDPLNDTVIYTAGGQIVDIDIYSNKPVNYNVAATYKMELTPTVNQKTSNPFIEELERLHYEQFVYYQTLAEELEKIIPIDTNFDKKILRKEKSEKGANWTRAIPRDQNPNKYTDELAYYFKLSHEYINPDIKWRHDGKSFDGYRIKITVLKTNPVTVGAKLTGRYGNKGVISKIVPDDEMPTTEEGYKAEVILNPLGVINRLNLGQLIEHHINFMSERLRQLIEENRGDIIAMEDLFYPYVKALSPEMYEYLTGFDGPDLLYSASANEKKEFFDEIIEKGIFIHQSPFFGNTDNFEEIYRRFPHLHKPYKFKGIERPIVMGDMYFMRLKHESSNKLSARSTSSTNIRGLPSKSTLKKDKKVLLSHTPIRMGEMEVTNLMMTKDGKMVSDLLRSYSTSEEDRAILNKELLTAEDPLNINVFEKLGDSPSVNRQFLDSYLDVLDLKLED